MAMISVRTRWAVALWLAQGLLALVFVGAGLFKMGAPIQEVARAIPWAGDLPPWSVRLIGAIDIAGGLGVVLPAATRILPHLCVWAAAGSALLQLLAIGFHTLRGETQVLPLNLVLLGCALFVAWGRRTRAPLVART